MSVSRSLLGFSCLFMGILVAIIHVKIAFVYTYVLTIASLVMLLRLRVLALMLIAFFLVGFFVGNSIAQPYKATENYFDSRRGQEITVSGVVVEDPSYHSSSQREFHISNIVFLSGEHEVPSRLQLRVRSYQARTVLKGDSIVVTGKLGRALGNRLGSVNYASVVVERKSSSLLESQRRNFFAAIFSTLPDPQSSLGLGFLVGVRTLLPEELSENLRTTGLTHIVAVSGYNLTILVFMTRKLLAGYSKFLATFAAVILIISFLAVTGSAPSIVRASIVAGLSMTAWYFGRSVNPLVLLISSAALSALINPFYIWRDIGWYLSFFAFFGVLILAPQIIKRFFRRPPKLVGQLLVETTCAQLLTLPIIAHIFGDISVISILANLVVLPLIPLAMLTTFFTGFTFMYFNHLILPFSIIARFILTFIVDIVTVMASLPGALASFTINQVTMIFVYASILAFTWFIYRRNQLNPPNFEVDALY